jgi:hypothetical protein
MHVILEVSPLTEHHLLSRGPDILVIKDFRSGS